MKYLKNLLFLVLSLTLLAGCGTQETPQGEQDTVLATTYPMYFLASSLLEGAENVKTEVLVQEAVSCIHDYTLTTTQMRLIEGADLIVMNGSDLEHFMESALSSVPVENIIDTGASLQSQDAHTWLSVELYMAQNDALYQALVTRYPEQEALLKENHQTLSQNLSALQTELLEELQALSCRELITFHDGFSSFAQGLGLTIAAAIEEEEGAEASAQQIQEICDLIQTNRIPAIFVEKNGSTNASDIISAETGVQVFVLNTMMDGETDYFTAMRENVQAVKEALS